MKIALLGDYQPEVTAHQAVPLALDLAAAALRLEMEFDWIRSDEIDLKKLPEYDAVWCVPFSPYQDRDAVLALIKQVREGNQPFLGTCAGYQHAVLEFARNQLGHSDADSVEDHPDCKMPLLSALTCRLTDESDAINIQPESIAGSLYGIERVAETYHCGYGLNRQYLPLFVGSAMRFSGFDDDDDPCVFEVIDKPFYVGTAFQPERSALNGVAHPLIVGFMNAAQHYSTGQ